MLKAEKYTKEQIDKLGNAIVFLCEKMTKAGEKVSKTHILKLIFIIEEFSIRKYGIPVFDLRFNAWHLGPVSPDLFFELSEEPTLLSDFIEKTSFDGNDIFKAKKKFDDGEFNEKEIQLMTEIVDKFQYCTANELINYTHKKGSPWYNTAEKNGLLEAFESKKRTTTDIEINLFEIIQDVKSKIDIYNTHQEFLAISRNLKRN